MKYFGKIFVFLVMAVICSPNIMAQDDVKSYYVSAKGNDDANNGRSETSAFKTIKRAIEVASQGAIKRITIIGTLSQTSEGGSSQDTVFLIAYNGKTELTITGKDNSSGKERAVLSAIGTNKRVIRNTGSGPVRFENIEISGANTDGDGAGIYGGNYLTLGKGVVIKNNTTSMTGGGLFAGTAGCTCIIEDGVTITQNTASKGGGIYIPYSWNTLTIKGGVITKNTATVAGGGIYYEDACNTFTVENCVISENSAGSSGGGLYLEGKCSITNITVLNNVAKEKGGGIYMGWGAGVTYSSADGADVTIATCDFQGNKAQFGAGIYLAVGKCTLSSGSINSNAANFVGGGVYVATKTKFTPGDVVISGNRAADGGEDIFEQD